MLAPLAIAAVIAWNIGLSYWWSPYYKIGLTPSDNQHGWELNVNESGHQSMMPSDEKERGLRIASRLGWIVSPRSHMTRYSTSGSCSGARPA